MKKLLMLFVFVTGMAFLNHSIASELIPMLIIKEDGVGNGKSIYSFLTTVVFLRFHALIKKLLIQILNCLLTEWRCGVLYPELTVKYP